MPEHYTKNTLECTAWCNRCGKFTQHRVDGGRRGPCIDPAHPVQELSQAQLARKKKEARERQQPMLFDGGA
jgi:hypothetical protein